MFQTLDRAPAPFKGTEVHTLSNGLRLLLKEDHTVPVVSLQTWARCGAVDETPRINGISHGLEHMVFKGTPTRTASEINQTIEGMGGYINAATQLETTHYYVDVPSYGLKPTLDVFADTLLHPTFPQDELDRERLVILEEIRSRDDNPDAILWDEFVSNLFKGTPYATKVIGSEKTVSELSQIDLFDYFRLHYVPENKCVVAVGDFEKENMLHQLKSLFESEKPNPIPPQPKVILEDYEPISSKIRKPVQMAYLAMGIPTPGLGSEDLFALDVMSDVIGGGASARLYQNLRETQQIVLSIACDYIPFMQKGVFSVFAEATPDCIDRAIGKIEEEIESFHLHPPRLEELARAKARIKSEWLHSSETPRGQASTLGSLAILGHLPLINDYLSKIAALSVSDLMSIYEKTIRGKKFSVTCVIPQ